jgi:hypothetical protein
MAGPSGSRAYGFLTPGPLRKRSLPVYDEVDDLVRNQVGDAEEDRRHNHEPDHDAGGLHYLTSVRPLYPLELAPASLQEGEQPGTQPWPRRDGPRARPFHGCEFSPAFVRLVLGLGRQLDSAASARDARLGDLGVWGRVRDRIRRAVARELRFGAIDGLGFDAVKLSWVSAAVSSLGTKRRSPGLPHSPTGNGLARSPFLCAFAVTSHGLRLAGLSMRRVTPAPATVLAHLNPFRVVALALIGLVVAAPTLLASEGHSDPNVSTGHRAYRVVVVRYLVVSGHAQARPPDASRV